MIFPEINAQVEAEPPHETMNFCEENVAILFSFFYLVNCAMGLTNGFDKLSTFFIFLWGSSVFYHIYKHWALLCIHIMIFIVSSALCAIHISQNENIHDNMRAKIFITIIMNIFLLYIFSFLLVFMYGKEYFNGRQKQLNKYFAFLHFATSVAFIMVYLV